MSLRVGIIGLGVGEQHIDGYRSATDCDVVAVCDRDPERLAAVGARHPGLRLDADPERILDDPAIDIVSVATWDDAHFDQVARALEHGKHVFVEKPLCQFPQQAQALHELLRARPRQRISSNLPLRASPRFRLVRERIARGEFGRLFYLEADYDYGRVHKIVDGWRGRIDHYSVTLGGAVHMVDLLLWLAGERPLEAVAYGNRIATSGTRFQFDDMVASLLRFESGLVAKVTANFACVHPHYHDVKVFGTDATFVNALGEGVVHHRGAEPGTIVSEPVAAAYPGIHKGDLLAGFVAAIQRDEEPPVGRREIFETMAACFAIDAAKEANRPVEVTEFDWS